VARALIVGCGCRGRGLAAHLAAAGWQVRGTTRGRRGLEAIEAAGAEAALADPDQAATIVDLVADVAVVYWLLGSAVGGAEALAAIHGPRLERVLERLVDSPVRGFVYEGAGAVDRDRLERGAAIVRAAAARWRIPVDVVDASPLEPARWTDAMAGAGARLIGAAG
jgi:nucleoside-diphosphate-sugar epimerase